MEKKEKVTGKKPKEVKRKVEIMRRIPPDVLNNE